MRVYGLLVMCVSLLWIVPQETPSPQPIQRGFRDIQLGEAVEVVKEKLTRDTFFLYREELDVSFSPGRDDIIIQTRAWKYITNAQFQFYNERLSLIVLQLDTTQLDYFGMYRKFVEKYGDPEEFSPSLARWSDEKTILILERPLTVKYIDRVSHEELTQGKAVLQSTEDMAREAFMDLF